ncbi:dymeclin [Skeletonema marinoi]|uniref:Dymeclin n=1 Tax=Skeletonema marinoi TaxID=267567 RepID=A0AAD8YJP1_9STRA|nr:dymeclin [Skeletonema marinoi]
MGASASKIKFRESLTSLISRDVSPEDAEFWDELWKIPSSADEVFELLTPDNARRLRDERFDNLATLFTQATAQLCQLWRRRVELCEGFDTGVAVSAGEGRFGGWGFECGGFVLGKKSRRNDDGDKNDDDGEDDDEDDSQEPLALLVVHAAMHMLFLPQFTCEFYEEDDEDDENDSDDDESDVSFDEEDDAEEKMRIRKGVRLTPHPAGIVWSPGVGFTNDGKCSIGNESSKYRRPRSNKSKTVQNPEAAYTRKYDKNRIEVLRLLLATCSDPLFSPADEYNPLASRWMSVAVAADAPNAPCLFYSLLNTVISYDPSNSSFGGVPYSSKLASDSHVKLVDLSAQVLCVLLDCGLPGDPLPVENQYGEPVVAVAEAQKGGFNIFRSSQSKLECYQEILILLWKTLEENPLFLDFILTRCDVCELVVPICYLMYTSRQDASKIGLVHLCTFILLKLSGERSFGVSLNRPFRTKLPCDLPLFSGSHADLVSITLHKMIVNGSYRLFLYSGEKAYKHLALLLEIFNNIIQYQYNGNQHLVYAIVRRKDAFGRLASLTLHKAVQQCSKAFPAHLQPEYDADAAEQVAALSIQDVDETGNPIQSADSREDKSSKRADNPAKSGNQEETVVSW